MRGTITTFNPAKGQGFIDDEIYFSYTAICSKDQELVKSNMPVEYELSQNLAYGKIAVKVELIELE